MAAARAAVDSAGPLAETTPPRRTGSVESDVGGAIPGMRDAAAAARRARVLLAGMDASTRAIARVALGDRVDVREAATLGMALDVARDARPDLVILAWKTTGADVVGALRSDPLTRESKVLLVVDDRDATSREVMATGVDEKLAAPFSPLQLQVKLRRLLGADAVGA
jgi:serine/threonine-protein kinase